MTTIVAETVTETIATTAALPLAKDVTVAQVTAMLKEAGQEIEMSARRPALLEKARELKLIAPRAPDMEEPACSSDQVCIPLKDKDGVVVNWATIDAADREKVESLSWWILQTGPKLYAQSQKGLMHILLMGDAPPGEIIDHRDGNGLNNVRSNIRFATRGLNSQNKVKKQGTTSKYYGVSLSKWGWTAFHGKRLGYFQQEEHAAFAYDEKVREVHGQLGKINGLEKPDGYEPYKAREASGLLPGVRRSKNRFQAQYWDQDLKKHVYLGGFATEAAAHKAYMQHKEEKEAEREPRRLATPISRNEDGIAIIPVKKGKETVYALVDDDKWHDFMKVGWHIEQHSEYVVALYVRMHKLVLEGDLIDHRNG